jgi:hypothetical protein
MCCSMYCFSVVLCIVYFCVVLCIVCFVSFYYFLCVNVYCILATGWLPKAFNKCITSYHTSFYLQNCAPESFSSEFNAAHANEMWHNRCTYRPSLLCDFVKKKKEKRKLTRNVSTYSLQPITLNSTKMRSTVSQVTTCGLTEAEMTKLANTILRFVVATDLQTG